MSFIAPLFRSSNRIRLHVLPRSSNTNLGGAVLAVEKGAVVSDTQIKVPTLEEIELRAYEIYLKRGDADDVALEDWLAAEKELLASRQTDAVGLLMKRAAAS
jgi:Protein of unknown function (DUF2934)